MLNRKVSPLLAWITIIFARVVLRSETAEARCNFPKGYPDPIIIANRRVEAGRKQSSYLRIYQFSDRIEAHGKHSNGHRTSGETFRTLVLFLDGSNRVIYAIGKLHGVNPTYGGRTKEVCWCETITDVGIRASVATFQVIHDTCDSNRGALARDALKQLLDYIYSGAGTTLDTIVDEHKRNC